MAESLGDALLYLRTDDREFTAGVAKAEGQARQLSGTLDKTAASADRAGAQLAGTGQRASTAGAQFDQAGQQVVKSSGAQRAGLQQLTMNLNDMATMYSLGARPMQIFASQSGQVTQALQLVAGGGKGVLSILGSPWVLMATTAATVLLPLISNLLGTEDALDKVGDAAEDAMAKLSEAVTQANQFQGAIDANQKKLIEGLAAEAKATEELRQVRQTLGNVSLSGPEDRGTRAEFTRRIERLEGERDAARAQVAEARQGFANIDGLRSAQGVQEANQERFRDTPDRPDRVREPRADRTAEREALRLERTGEQHQSRLNSLQEQTISLRLQMVDTVDARAQLEHEALSSAVAEQFRQIEANQDLSLEQKNEQRSRVQLKEGLERQLIEQRKSEDLAAQQLEIARVSIAGETELAQLTSRLADTREERRAAELEILDLAYEQRRLELAQVRDHADSEVARRNAETELAGLDVLQAGERELVNRENASPTEQYLRDLENVGKNLDDELSSVAIDGLELLQDELADTILGAQSLGDMFTDVADSIVADLLRIAIQQAIIEPLSSALLGGGSGEDGDSGGSGLLGGLFAGLFAGGGLIPTGQFGIVGERGPEAVIGTTSGARVLSNADTRSTGALGGGGSSVTLNFNGAVSNGAEVRRSAAQAGAALSRVLAQGRRGQ